MLFNFVFSMSRERPIRKRRCARWVGRAGIATPEYAEREPYYNSTNYVSVARSYLGSRRVVKYKAPREALRPSAVRASSVVSMLRRESAGETAALDKDLLESARREGAPMKLDLLAIAAHPDDVELTCGGTLLKMARLGYKTGILDLTAGEMGTRGTPETRAKEAAKAAKILGVRSEER